jgi:hypothetical protein
MTSMCQNRCGAHQNSRKTHHRNRSRGIALADGAFALTVMVSPTPSLIIETDRNLLPFVKSDVSNNRLDLHTERSYSVDRRIKITVTSPIIANISGSGGNDIIAEGLIGGSLSIWLNGSNNARLSGKISAFTCQMSGSNVMIAKNLTADSAPSRSAARARPRSMRSNGSSRKFPALAPSRYMAIHRSAPPE